MTRTAQVVICGAGITGVSSAYHLAAHGITDVLLVDPLPPLSLTSDKSTESYRNWWPDADMQALMNRSIDLMDDIVARTGNRIRMNRRGYLYVTADQAGLSAFTERAERIARLGAGPLRIHSAPDSDYAPGMEAEAARLAGADLLLGSQLIRRHFPYLTTEALAALHVRRAGWLSAQQLGMYLLEAARAGGAALERNSIESVDTGGGRIRGVRLASGEYVACEVFVNAAGPYLNKVGGLLGIDIPVHAELHLKATIEDHLGIVDRGAPLLIWDDAQCLPWEADEAASLRADPETSWLTEEFPAGVHVRPEGSGESRHILMLWDYAAREMDPVFPPPLDDLYPELALRGLSRMLPDLQRYLGRAPRPYLDGGYYVKTRENRLLAGPLPLEGAYVLGGVGGHGIMSACAAGELLAAHVAAAQLPSYAKAFSLERYADPEYQRRLEQGGDSGEL